MHRKGWRAKVWFRLICLADWVAPDQAFRQTCISFTFEQGRGIVTNTEDKGCPLWYHGPDYDRAHKEAG